MRNFQFVNGEVFFDNPRTGSSFVGYYQMSQASRFRIHIDNNLDSWSFSRNNVLLSEGPLNAAWQITRIRFNYAAEGPDISGTAIDNLLVAVPEPACLPWFSLAVASLVSLHRRARFAHRHSPGPG